MLDRLTKSGAVVVRQLVGPIASVKAARATPRGTNGSAVHDVAVYRREFSFRGTGVRVAVYDEGGIHTLHEEFRDTASASSRAANVDVPTPDDHATQVAGVIGAAGVDKDAEGVAPLIALRGFGWTRTAESVRLHAAEFDITNHLYGRKQGWEWPPGGQIYWYGAANETEDSLFGKYSLESRDFDATLYDLPKALAVVSAGNDRDDVAPSAGRSYKVRQPGGRWTTSTLRRNDDGFDGGGFDTVSHFCVAKNAVCVGAFHQDPSAGVFLSHPSSNWGPTDDGRVKPDLVANGAGVKVPSFRKRYDVGTETSMAAPVVSGIASLLAEQFMKENRDWPPAILLRAILIHSAFDLGLRGPDAKFGWGMAKAGKAGRVLARRDGHDWQLLDLSAGLSHIENVVGTGEPVRVTLAWADPPGTSPAGLDDANPVLIRDLDLSLSKPGVTVFPYRLTASKPDQEALADAANRVDTVEVVETDPSSDSWTLRVDTMRLPPGTVMQAALIVSGLRR